MCCGAGGVGKTTTAAALALRAAERHGRRTVVLTIDPARRLAQSLGLSELDNTPRQVKGINPQPTTETGTATRSAGRTGSAASAAKTDEAASAGGAGLGSAGGGSAGGGELHAMMLDMKRTFDDVVLAHTDPERAAEIFANPFYQAMSSTFAGTQEYMAMEKLGQLHARGEWDLIVVDTPPSRSALDFLDAPARLSRFLDGRMLRLLLAPARSGGRSMFSLVTASFGVFSRVVQKVLGAQLLTDLSGFVAALDSMFGGFRQRAEQTYRVLQARETAFLLVAAPEPDAVREAAYFASRLGEERMPLAGLVLNRVHQPAVDRPTAEQSLAAAMRLAEMGGYETTVAALRSHALLIQQAARERQVAAEFTEAFPQIPMVAVPAQPADVHDVDGLRMIGAAIGRS